MTTTLAPATAHWRALGTTVTLAVTEPDRLTDATHLLTQHLDVIDRACSRFRDDSEIVALNQSAGRPVVLSEMLADALAAAMLAAELTSGDVDPTVGSAMVELGYDRDFAALPADAPAVAVRVQSLPNWRAIDFDQDNRIVRLNLGVQLDLGATAKAFAADVAAERIADNLDTGVLVSLGGDIAIAGALPPGGWPVRVQDLPGLASEPATGPACVISLAHGGLATSSTRARRWRRGGQWLHHIIDPRTGLPANTPWRTVSVAASTCLLANIASTAAVIRGTGAVDWLSRLRLPARLVAHDNAVVTVGAWPAAVTS